MVERKYILDAPLSDTVRLQFEEMSALHSWIAAELRFWKDLSDTLGHKHFNGACRPWWEEQIKYLERLQGLIMGATRADTHNVTQIAAIKENMMEMEAGRPYRFLCSKIESDGFLKGFAVTDEAAVEAGFLSRRGPYVLDSANSKIPGTELTEVRNAQARFTTGLQLHLTLKQLTDSETNRKVLEAQLRAAAAVKGLVKHWNTRANTALLIALVCLMVLASLASLTLYKATPILADLWHQLMQPALAAPTANAAMPGTVATTSISGQAAQSMLAIAPFFVIIAIPLIWLIRHISRLFIENLADYRDAALRATMAGAYITMLGDDKMNPQKEERAVILAALFRPSTAQPTDESVPLPLLELLKGKS